jgi:hypothetical protein
VVDVFHLDYNFNNFGVDDLVHTKQLVHNLISIDLLCIGYGTEDVYHMDDIGLFYHAQPNKTLDARKKLWVQNS